MGRSLKPPALFLVENPMKRVMKLLNDVYAVIVGTVVCCIPFAFFGALFLAAHEQPKPLRPSIDVRFLWFADGVRCNNAYCMFDFRTYSKVKFVDGWPAVSSCDQLTGMERNICHAPVKADSNLTFLPPPQYNKPYPGVLMMQRLSVDDLQKVCSFNAYACSQPNAGRAPTVACIIFMLSDEDLKARGVNPEDTYWHEIGHCNGWPSDHGGLNWQRKGESVE
jgi:hypothetical protein